jgi:hypothetical protein
LEILVNARQADLRSQAKSTAIHSTTRKPTAMVGNLRRSLGFALIGAGSRLAGVDRQATRQPATAGRTA